MKCRSSYQWALTAVVAILVLLSVPATASAAAGETVSTVGERVMCQCGCNLVLTSCNHSNCGWGIPAKEFIGEQLEDGRSGDEIVEYYVSQYGEKILAAPPKSGFNLTAWIAPFVALAAGAVGIYYLVVSWARRRDYDEVEAEVVPVSREEMDEDLRTRLDDELKDFD